MRKTPSGILVPQEPEHKHKGFRFEINKMTGYWHGVAVHPELEVGFKAVSRYSSQDVGEQLTILIDALPEQFFSQQRRMVENAKIQREMANID